MPPGRTRVLETPQGHGSVIQNGETISAVRYWIRVIQEYQVITDHGGTSEAPAMKSISAKIWPADTTALYGRDNLILHLDDGRSMPFFVSDGDAESGFQITPEGSLG